MKTGFGFYLIYIEEIRSGPALSFHQGELGFTELTHNCESRSFARVTLIFHQGKFFSYGAHFHTLLIACTRATFMLIQCLLTIRLNFKD